MARPRGTPTIFVLALTNDGKTPRTNTMGKKKGGKAPPRSAAAEERDLPQWHAALPSATAENVLELPQVDHGWVVTIIDADRRKRESPRLCVFTSSLH